MKIAELQAKQGKVEVVGKIIEKADPREFDKFGKKGKVCNAKLQDDSGVITLTLWNEQADDIQIGDTVAVKNGFVSEWQGDKQLTGGKFGTVEKVEGDAASAPASEPTPAPEATPQASEPAPEPTPEPAQPTSAPEQPAPKPDTDEEIIEEEVSVEEEDIE